MSPSRFVIAASTCAQVWLAAAPSRAAILPPPLIEIHGAAIRVQVISESRADIAVSLPAVTGRAALKVRRTPWGVRIDGLQAHNVRDCRLADGRAGVEFREGAPLALRQLPIVVIHAPERLRIITSDGVFGSAGPVDELDLTATGCGDWTLSPVRKKLRLNQAGRGTVVGASAEEADVSVDAAGPVSLTAITTRLSVVTTGAGPVRIGSVNGRLDVKVGGAGDVEIAAGSVDQMRASIAGSGAIRFRGQANRLSASIAGTGDIDVDRVVGPVTGQVLGGGGVRIVHRGPSAGGR